MPYKVTGITPRQTEIYFNGVSGLKPTIPTTFAKLEEAAHKILSAEGMAYLVGGAGNEHTMQLNRTRFDRYAIVPRILVDTSNVTMDTHILDQHQSVPFMIAPVASQDLVNEEGELATARAAASENITMIYSMQASHPMEDIAKASSLGQHWFQLYWSKSNEFNHSIIRRAEACGCSALVITLDTQALGWRPRDLDLGFAPTKRSSGFANYSSDRVFDQLLDEYMASNKEVKKPPINLQAIATALSMAYHYPGGFLNNLKTLRAAHAARMLSMLMGHPTLSWEDIVGLRKITKLPIILKGVLHPEDARLALKHGMDGVVVSNHGGRQMASCIPTVDALPAIAAELKGKMPVLFDSGIQNGDDIFKAIALGADAVLIGRPFMYALALAGEIGVGELLRNLKAEFELTMTLAGCTSIADITADRLVRLD